MSYCRLPFTPPALGNDHRATIVSIGNLATVHSSMAKDDLALPLARECLARSRRVFGGGHPQTLQNVGDLGQLLFEMGDHAAAAPLLREAVEGLTAVYSAEHPLVCHYQDFLDDLPEASPTEEPTSEADGQQEEETMYECMAKRRRRE